MLNYLINKYKVISGRDKWGIQTKLDTAKLNINGIIENLEGEDDAKILLNSIKKVLDTIKDAEKEIIKFLG